MNSDQLKNKVAIVTGSSRGIGKAIAIELAEKGVKVVLNGRDNKRLQDTNNEFLKKGYDVLSVAADVSKFTQCQTLITRAVKRFGKIDILINNAGDSSRGTVEKMAVSNFKNLMETNYNGGAYLSKYVVPHLKKTKGHIIFINSVGGFRGMPYNSAYTASKMAQAALADALRIELYDTGIHVGLMYVGFTENDPKKSILDVDGTRTYLPKRENIRLAKPQSVAKSVRFMIEKRNDKTTLTELGLLANFMIRYLPRLSNWILLVNRERIEKQFTYIGGEKVVQEE
ncbi:SDR family oxidoreductase [Maribacter arenosus]|uniref:SDR family oxidoreductase n=1 Tax=Maribacter arenosus TaxID=1854708 RepID=A0ABR7VBK5_9FLAO|nr:SDR family oxidoreductase [Maribacter arenosus]MBD0851036.1 SDR family oxidoreductase [Maribacter arenosus]